MSAFRCEKGEECAILKQTPQKAKIRWNVRKMENHFRDAALTNRASAAAGIWALEGRKPERAKDPDFGCSGQWEGLFQIEARKSRGYGLNLPERTFFSAVA